MIEPLKEFAHSKLLSAQRLKRFVLGDDFERAVDNASESELKDIRSLIDKMDLAPLQRLVKRLNMHDLESLSYRDLRQVAKNYHIRGWHWLPKESLIFEIEQARQRNNEANANNEHVRATGSNENPSNSIGDS